MPWCEDCSKFWNPNSLPPDGTCPSCGRVIGDRYRILDRIGEGGMGRVYLAEHVRMGRKSAFKIMKPGKLFEDGRRGDQVAGSHLWRKRAFIVLLKVGGHARGSQDCAAAHPDAGAQPDP